MVCIICPKTGNEHTYRVYEYKPGLYGEKGSISRVNAQFYSEVSEMDLDTVGFRPSGTELGNKVEALLVSNANLRAWMSVATPEIL